MKFKFTPKELELLDWYATRLALVVAKTDGRLYHVVAKMRHKFRGTPLYTNLTQKERKVLYDLTSYRLSQLTGLAATTEEAEMLNTLVNRLMNGETEDAPNANAQSN